MGTELLVTCVSFGLRSYGLESNQIIVFWYRESTSSFKFLVAELTMGLRSKERKHGRDSHEQRTCMNCCSE